MHSLVLRNANEQSVSPSGRFIPVLTTRKFIALALLRKIFVFVLGIEPRFPDLSASSLVTILHTLPVTK